MSDVYLDRVEAAARLKCSVRYVDRLRERGELLAKKMGRSVLIPSSEVEALLERLEWEQR